MRHQERLQALEQRFTMAYSAALQKIQELRETQKKVTGTIRKDGPDPYGSGVKAAAVQAAIDSGDEVEYKEHLRQENLEEIKKFIPKSA